MIDKLYIDMEYWKCTKSPTNAHWWVEKDYSTGNFQCKYCGKIRWFPWRYDQALSLCKPKALANFIMAEDSYQYRNKRSNNQYQIHGVVR